MVSLKIKNITMELPLVLRKSCLQINSWIKSENTGKSRTVCIMLRIAAGLRTISTAIIVKKELFLAH
jgi:hypothetical protein